MARENAMAEPAAEAASEESTGKGGTVMAVIALVSGLVLGGAGGWLGVGPLLAERASPDAAEEGGHGDSGHAPSPLFMVENVVVNPAGSDGMRFLVATVAFETDGASTVEALTARDAAVRDALLAVLGRKNVEELAAMESRDSLKSELRASVASLLDEGELRRIYLPQFVIQ